MTAYAQCVTVCGIEQGGNGLLGFLGELSVKAQELVGR